METHMLDLAFQWHAGHSSKVSLAKSIQTDTHKYSLVQKHNRTMVVKSLLGR